VSDLVGLDTGTPSIILKIMITPKILCFPLTLRLKYDSMNRDPIRRKEKGELPW